MTNNRFSYISGSSRSIFFIFFFKSIMFLYMLNSFFTFSCACAMRIMRNFYKNLPFHCIYSDFSNLFFQYHVLKYAEIIFHIFLRMRSAHHAHFKEKRVISPFLVRFHSSFFSIPCFDTCRIHFLHLSAHAQCALCKF